VITPSDVATAFRIRFAAVVTGATAEAGGRLVSPEALYRRAYALPVDVGDAQTTPYAVFDVSAGATETFGGCDAIVAGVPQFCTRAFCDFAIACRIYADVGMNAKPHEIQTRIMADWLSKWGDGAGWELGTGNGCMVATPGNFSLDLEPTLRNGRDVTRFSFAINLKIKTEL